MHKKFSLITDKDHDVMAGPQPGYSRSTMPVSKPLKVDPNQDPMTGFNPKFNKPALTLDQMYSPKIGLGLKT